jgi:hypothetical protein
MMDPNWLKVKTAGLPRWAWVTLFSSAVIVGLYLRNRDTGETEPEEEEEMDPEETGLSMYDGTETAGSLGSVGLAGPAAGQVVPVEAPFLPEGFVDLLSAQNTNNVEAQQAIVGLAQDALAREPSERVETIVERAPSESNQGVTGGGSPKRKPHHKAPPKKPKHKAKPKAKQPGRKRGKQPPKKRGGAGGKKPPRHHATRRR